MHGSCDSEREIAHNLLHLDRVEMMTMCTWDRCDIRRVTEIAPLVCAKNHHCCFLAPGTVSINLAEGRNHFAFVASVQRLVSEVIMPNRLCALLILDVEARTIPIRGAIILR